MRYIIILLLLVGCSKDSITDPIEVSYDCWTCKAWKYNSEMMPQVICGKESDMNTFRMKLYSKGWTEVQCDKN